MTFFGGLAGVFKIPNCNAASIFEDDIKLLKEFGPHHWREK
jgi:hypothetical protein